MATLALDIAASACGPAALGLPSEPYVFVVGSDGTVSAKFEGVAYHDELVAALDDLLRRAEAGRGPASLQHVER